MIKKTILLLLGLPLILFSPRFALAQSGGTIRGKIVFAGTPARSNLISMAKDPNCLKINAGKKVFEEALKLGTSNIVQNVFVHLKTGVPNQRYSPPADALVLDQKGCLYSPRVQGAVVGQNLKILNSDQTLHNIHSQSPKYLLNIAQPIAGMTYNLPLKTEEVMLQFKCQIHQWMIAYIGVLPHPFFAVSDASGAYEIKNVPAGKYEVQAWHEQLGTLVQSIEVKSGQAVTLDFTYGPKVATLSPGFVYQEVSIDAPAEVILQPQRR